MRKHIQKIDSIVGLQYGDEGKGKIVDSLSSHYDIIVRHQGGANSGHTIWRGDEKLVFNTIPSGMVSDNIIGCLCGSVVIDPKTFMDEIWRLSSIPRLVDRLVIADSLSVVDPCHRLLDIISEAKRAFNGKEIIGSTLRGNTPALVSRLSRTSMTLGRMHNVVIGGLSSLRDVIMERLCEIINSEQLIGIYTSGDKLMMSDEEVIIDGVPFYQYCELWLESARELCSMVRFESCITGWLLNEWSIGRKILIESAQGVMLDINHGDYPYVTSSSVTAQAGFYHTGLPMMMTGRVYGVFKPYITRVGRGSFPTEITNDLNIKNTISERGHEYGSVTGRPRRIGWLNIEELIYACSVSGVTDLVMTKLDVVSGLDMKQAESMYAGRSLVDYRPYDCPDRYQDFRISVSGEEKMASSLDMSVSDFISSLNSVLSSLPWKPVVRMVSVSQQAGIIPLSYDE